MMSAAVLEFWLRGGSAGIVQIPFILLYAIAAALVWLTHLSPARLFFASCVGIAGPFFALRSRWAAHDHAACRGIGAGGRGRQGGRTRLCPGCGDEGIAGGDTRGGP
jgi:hypothetical protein